MLGCTTAHFNMQTVGPLFLAYFTTTAVSSSMNRRLEKSLINGYFSLMNASNVKNNFLSFRNLTNIYDQGFFLHTVFEVQIFFFLLTVGFEQIYGACSEG